MSNLAMVLLLLAAMTLFYVAIGMENKRLVEVASMALIGAVLVAFLVWFVICGPRPDYLPPYGTGEQPIEMRD